MPTMNGMRSKMVTLTAKAKVAEAQATEARAEAQGLGETLAALESAFPGLSGDADVSPYVGFLRKTLTKGLAPEPEAAPETISGETCDNIADRVTPDAAIEARAALAHALDSRGGGAFQTRVNARGDAEVCFVGARSIPTAIRDRTKDHRCTVRGNLLIAPDWRAVVGIALEGKPLAALPAALAK